MAVTPRLYFRCIFFNEWCLIMNQRCRVLQSGIRAQVNWPKGSPKRQRVIPFNNSKTGRLRDSLERECRLERKYACICLPLYVYISDLDLLISRMNTDRHCGCMGWPCHHQRLGKVPRVSLESHLERVEIFIHGRLAEVPNDCLRFNHNQALFFLLTLWGNPLWHYRVEELHPGERAFMVARDYCLCKWQPMGFNLNEEKINSMWERAEREIGMTH